jgi:hypothetical protein
MLVVGVLAQVQGIRREEIPEALVVQAVVEPAETLHRQPSQDSLEQRILAVVVAVELLLLQEIFRQAEQAVPV